ncbi:hypothetical protein M9H77_17181 [Catharanthus roseus]|uniref:Uncharacterized protein n=1 Tax=Catharanthus roseus TaxID=4058 RepID=A0ACC0B489_CATRO|nr:hypothetical protein M9H77_17181 [Catharanthus roseus]
MVSLTNEMQLAQKEVGEIMTKVEFNGIKVMNKLEELTGHVYRGKVKDNIRINVEKVKDDKKGGYVASIETPVKVKKMKDVFFKTGIGKIKQEEPEHEDFMDEIQTLTGSIRCHTPMSTGKISIALAVLCDNKSQKQLSENYLFENSIDGDIRHSAR